MYNVQSLCMNYEPILLTLTVDNNMGIKMKRKKKI